MSHLTIETLARLIDETPDAAESAHLEACADCRAELEGLKADAAALAELPELEPPSAQWLAVEQRLAQEGLLRMPQPHRMPARWLRPALQLAAALVVFVLGNYTAPLFRAERGSQPAVSQAAPSPATSGDAATLVRNAEQAYLNALTQYAELTGRTEASDPVARLAALESIVLSTRAALGQAPADPVINGYHLTALAQREATLKQMATAAGKTWF